MGIDIVCVIILFLGCFIGYKRGIIKTVFSILGLLIAIIATFKLSPIAIKFIKQTIQLDANLSILLGFLLTFILFYIGIRKVGSTLEKGLVTLQLNIFNKLSGASIFGIVSIVLFSFGVYYLSHLNIISDAQRKESLTYPYLRKLPDASQQFIVTIKPHFKSFWDQTIDTMNEINEQSDKKTN